MRVVRASSSELRAATVRSFFAGEAGGGAFWWPFHCAAWDGRVTVVVVTVLVFCDCSATLKFGRLVEWASWVAVDVASACASFVSK